MAIRAPRRLSFWFGCCAGLAVSFVGVTHLVAGGTFVDHLLSPRVFAWHGARYHLMKYLRLSEFPLAMISFCSPAVPFLCDRLILAAYGVISICAATIFAGFEGTSYNMFQDAAVFLAIAAGVLLHELRSRTTTEASATPARPNSHLALCRSSSRSRSWRGAPRLLRKFIVLAACSKIDRRAERSFLAEAEFISERHGPAICESLLLCYRAGQPFTLDPFNSRQFILAGKLDQNELIRRIAAKEFTVVQLRADICDDRETELSNDRNPAT